MPTLILNKAAYKSKTTLLDAIRKGRMSAPKDELGRYRIDPAELFRVYSPPTEAANQSQPAEKTIETSVLQTTVEHLRQLIRQVESERDDLRRRLDQSEDERRASQTRLTALLTSSQQEAKPTPRPWWLWWLPV